MILRPATPDDVVTCRRIIEAGFETYRDFTPADWEPPDQAVWDERSRVELAGPDVFALLAEADGEPVGHVRLVPASIPSPDGSTPDWHLRHLFVLRSYWGTGVAKALHDAMLADLRRRGGVARLFTPAAQARARRFYEREGWRLHYGPYHDDRLRFDTVEYRVRP